MKNASEVFRMIAVVAAVAGCACAQNPSPAAKVGIIDIQRAVMSTNEGKRDLELFSKKYEPRQAALQKQASEIEELRKQLRTGEKMSDAERSALLNKVEQKQLAFRHEAESVQADYQNEQRETASRILKKMAPVVDKYAKDNGFTMIFDAQFWPQGPVLWANAAAADITGGIVNAYNAQLSATADANATINAQAMPSR